MTTGNSQNASAFKSIKAIDYTVIFVRDMDAMRHFYEDVMGFIMTRELSPNWIEYRIGENKLTLARPVRTEDDHAVSRGIAMLQLAFQVPVEQVDKCADELAAKGIEILSPPTDQDFGHRTLFFRDPDGNVLEMFAEI